MQASLQFTVAFEHARIGIPLLNASNTTRFNSVHAEKSIHTDLVYDCTFDSKDLFQVLLDVRVKPVLYTTQSQHSPKNLQYQTVKYKHDGVTAESWIGCSILLFFYALAIRSEALSNTVICQSIHAS